MLHNIKWNIIKVNIELDYPFAVFPQKQSKYFKQQNIYTIAWVILPGCSHVQQYGRSTTVCPFQFEKKLARNHTTMLCAPLNNSLTHHSRKQSCTAICLASHKSFKNDPQDMLCFSGEVRTNHKRHSSVDSYTWADQFWLTNKNLHSPTLVV